MMTFIRLKQEVEKHSMGHNRPQTILMASAALHWFEDAFRYTYGLHMKPTQFMGIPVVRMGDMAAHGDPWTIAFDGGWTV